MMRNRELGLWVSAGAAVVACSAPAAGPHGAASSGAASDSGSSGASGSVVDSGGATGATGTSGSRESDGGHAGQPDASDGGIVAKLGDGGAADAAPLPFEVTLQNAGRHGTDLRLTVQGNDPAAKTSEALVQLFDANVAPLAAFDTNWDGTPDSSQTRLHFDESTLGQSNFSATITLPNLFGAFPKIAAANVTLVDESGTMGASAMVMLTAQPTVAAGGACDPANLTNRCAEGLGCGAMAPSTCQAGVAPTLTQVAYYGGATPVELFVGTDPDQDLATLRVDFLSASGQSMTVDTSGDGNLTSSIVLDARSATGTTFSFVNNPVSSFTALVPKLSVTPIDSIGRVGMSTIATLASQPIHANGQSCDALGFTACGQGTVCSPGTPAATNTCGAVASLQGAKCKAAPSVGAPRIAGALPAWGTVAGVSLWDPPAGCALGTATNRPEALFTLKLDTAVSSLTLSTAAPETNFDTVLYVLPSCASSSTQALGCNDDGPGEGYASTLTLTNVSAGSYIVVVDAAGSQTGQFGLTVTAM